MSPHLCFRAEEKRKSRGWKWILSTLLVKCQRVQSVSGDNEGPYHLLIEIQWGVKEPFKKIHNQQDHHTQPQPERVISFWRLSLLLKIHHCPLLREIGFHGASVSSSIQTTLNRKKDPKPVLIRALTSRTYTLYMHASAGREPDHYDKISAGKRPWDWIRPVKEKKHCSFKMAKVDTEIHIQRKSFTFCQNFGFTLPMLLRWLAIDIVIFNDQ